jgi:hypothetical protein
VTICCRVLPGQAGMWALFGSAPAGLATHAADLDVTICCRVLPAWSGWNRHPVRQCSCWSRHPRRRPRRDHVYLFVCRLVFLGHAETDAPVRQCSGWSRPPRRRPRRDHLPCVCRTHRGAAHNHWQ